MKNVIFGDAMKLIVFILIAGIIFTCVGFYMFMQYEENAFTVDAVVTDIDIKEDSDSDSSTAYIHTYYGEYTVDGKKYTDVKLERRYSNSQFPEQYVGDTIEFTVNGENPDRKAKDGGFFSTVGLVTVVVCAVKIRKIKKKTEA